MLKKLKKIAKIKNGKDYKGIEDSKGLYPVLGTGGLITRTNNYLYDGESVLIGRKGTINKPQYINGKFWTIDTLFYTEIDKSLCLPVFFFYYLSSINLLKLSEGTTLPSLTKDTLYNLMIDIPPINVQHHIVDNITKEQFQ